MPRFAGISFFFVNVFVPFGDIPFRGPFFRKERKRFAEGGPRRKSSLMLEMIDRSHA